MFDKGIPIFELIDGFTYNGVPNLYNKMGKYIDEDLLNFLENQVLPDYLRCIDRSSSIEYVITALYTALMIVDRGDLESHVDYNLVAIMMVYHNLGIITNFKLSIRNAMSILELQSDSNILKKEYGINKKDLITISNAIEELDNLSKSNLYGMILSDAIRIPDLDIDYLIKRVANHVVTHFTYEPTKKLIDRIYAIINSRFKDRNSRGNILYTSVGQRIHRENIRDILEISNNKNNFIKRLEYLSNKEFEKKEARG